MRVTFFSYPVPADDHDVSDVQLLQPVQSCTHVYHVVVPPEHGIVTVFDVRVYPVGQLIHDKTLLSP